MSDLLIIVPARGGSKRLPDKNLLVLAGRNLMAWTAEAVRSSGLDAPCLLSTDDERIAAAGKALGWWVPFMRPRELATDSATSAAVVLHAIDWHRQNRGHDPEILLLLQVTSPFRRGALLRDAIDLLRSRTDMDAVITVSSLHARPEGVYFRDGENRLRPAMTAPAGEKLFAANGALYAIRTAAFRSTGRFVTERTLSIVLDGPEALDIDTALDWHAAQGAAPEWLSSGALPA